MKSIRILTALCLICSAGASKADIFLNFEDLPVAYNADDGGTDILNNYTPAITFGQNVQGTSGISWLPVIGNVGILNTFDGVFTTTGPSAITFGLNFTGATGLSFWYSSVNTLLVTAYDAYGNVINAGLAAGNSTVDGPGVGPTPFALLAPGVESVSITDGSGFGGDFVIDNLDIVAPNVPDAGSTLGLLGVAGIGLLAFRRKVVTA